MEAILFSSTSNADSCIREYLTDIKAYTEEGPIFVQMKNHIETNGTNSFRFLSMTLKIRCPLRVCKYFSVQHTDIEIIEIQHLENQDVVQSLLVTGNCLVWAEIITQMTKDESLSSLTTYIRECFGTAFPQMAMLLSYIDKSDQAMSTDNDPFGGFTQIFNQIHMDDTPATTTPQGSKKTKAPFNMENIFAGFQPFLPKEKTDAVVPAKFPKDTLSVDAESDALDDLVNQAMSAQFSDAESDDIPDLEE